MKDEFQILADIDKASNLKYKDLESKILSEKIYLESLRITTEICKETQEHKYCKKCDEKKKKKLFVFSVDFFIAKNVFHQIVEKILRNLPDLLNYVRSAKKIF